MKTLSVVAVSAAVALVLCATFTGPAAAMTQHAAHSQPAPSAAPSHVGHAQHDPAAAHAHDPKMHAAHHPGAVGTGVPIPADHVKWAPDAPLMEGMQQMRVAMAGLEHHEMGHLDESQVGQLATQVDEAAAYMFANCKLPAEPDVALHGVLARLMAGAEALHADPADPAPVADMRAALAEYPQLFDDPEFAKGAEDHDED